MSPQLGSIECRVILSACRHARWADPFPAPWRWSVCNVYVELAERFAGSHSSRRRCARSGPFNLRPNIHWPDGFANRLAAEEATLDLADHRVLCAGNGRLL